MEREIPETGRPSKSVTAMRRSPHDFNHHLIMIMPTLQLTTKEAELLNSIFASVADLDLYEHFDCESSESENAQLFDSLWDKVVKL